MITYTVLFALAACCTWLLVDPMRKLARRVGAVAPPDARARHYTAIPRLGGVAIAVGFLVAVAVGFGTNGVPGADVDMRKVAGLAVAALMILALGIYDDIRGANAPKKFAVQISAALILVVSGFRFDQFETSFTGTVSLGWAGMLVSIVWIVGVINAFNFIDGLDGLAAVVGLTMAGVFVALSSFRGDAITMVLMISIAGSLIGFIPWNRPPARVFMGDSGSLFLGLMFGAAAIAGSNKSPAAFTILGPMLALALPVVDSLFVAHGRFLRRKRPTLRARIAAMFDRDHNHLHHILLDRYETHARAVVMIWLITATFGGAAVLTYVAPLRGWGYVIAIVALAVVIRLRLATAERIDDAEPSADRVPADAIVRISRNVEGETVFAGPPLGDGSPDLDPAIRLH